MGDVDVSEATDKVDNELSELDVFLNIGRSAIPSNIIEAMLTLNTLGLVCIFISAGVAAKSLATPQQQVLFTLAKAILKITMLGVANLMRFTPVVSVSTSEWLYTGHLLSLALTVEILVGE